MPDKINDIVYNKGKSREENKERRSGMIGKRYDDVMTRLTNSRWRIVASEEGWTEVFTYDNSQTLVMEISHKDGIITGVYKYSY